MDTEWELTGHTFQEIVKEFGHPSIDLFASRVNHKCERYCSWDIDPDAHVINAFTICWKEEFWYAFPPFVLIPRVLKKVREENSTGIIVVPLWIVQPWYPEFKQLLFSKLIVFKPSTNLLVSPCRKLTHPLASDLTLVSGVLSGRALRKRTWKGPH